LLNQSITAGRRHSAAGAAVTGNGRYLAPPEDKDGKIWVRTSATILADAEALYALWHDVGSAPQWQEQMKEVVKTGPNTSHWVMMRDDKTIEWDAEMIADEPGKRIAWRSTGGDLDTAGEVIFEAAPTGRGRNPKQGVIEDLRHFKALAETGEIPRIQGQPHGPRGTSGSLKASIYGEKVAVPPGVRHAS
jgi:uncharacterized membrane protein